jgi:hypothetical protein
MFISKFWTLLLALAAGLMLAVILLAQDVINRERRENATAILYKEITKVDVALKLHARKRLDVLLSIAVDPDVRKMMATASINTAKASSVRDELLAILRKRNSDLGEYSADLLIALDRNGKAICQVGKNEREHGFIMSGLSAVDAALRGYQRDDIWKLGNDVFLIAARPVIHEGRYVGAFVHAQKVTDKLTSEISPKVQFAIFTGNMMAAVGTPSDKDTIKAQGSHIAKPLDTVTSSKQFKEKGYSEIQKIDAQENQFMAVYSKVRGAAAQNGVGYALVVPVTKITSPTDLYEKAGTQDIEALPLPLLITGVVLAILFGWAWNYLEGQRPISRLLKNIEALGKSDPKDQLNIYRFRRRIRRVAAAINSVMDYKMHSLLENNDSSSKSIDSILGKREDRRLSSASFKFAEPTGDEIPVAPPQGTTGAGPAIEKKSAPIPPTAPTTGAQRGLPPKPAGTPPTPPMGAKPISRPSAKIEALSPEEEKKYFNQIYNDFVALKKQLGESSEQLTFERFEGTLKKNRDTLIARYSCAQVKFQVYEKGGKASLKATPVKD